MICNLNYLFSNNIRDSSQGKMECMHQNDDHFFDIVSQDNLIGLLTPQKPHRGICAIIDTALTFTVQSSSGHEIQSHIPDETGVDVTCPKIKGWSIETRIQYQKTWDKRKEVRTRVDAIVRHILSEYDLCDETSHVLIVKKIKDVFDIDILVSLLGFRSVNVIVGDIQNKMIGPIGYQRKTTRPYKKAGKYIGLNGKIPRTQKDSSGVSFRPYVASRPVTRKRGRPSKVIQVV